MFFPFGNDQLEIGEILLKGPLNTYQIIIIKRLGKVNSEER